jgi:hypothetical protein
MASLMTYSRRTGPSAARPSPPREYGRAARALQLDVATHAVAVDDLAEQNSAAVTQLGDEVPELVPGIGGGDRLRLFGHPLASQYLHTFRAGQPVRIQRKLDSQVAVKPDEPWRGDRGRRDVGKEAVRQPGIAVIEGEVHGHCRALSSILSMQIWFRRSDRQARRLLKAGGSVWQR